MRGKLRDKSATHKRDILKREGSERRRSNKRDNRFPMQLKQFDDENYELDLDEAEEEISTPSKK
ncbi:MAG: hypothetical protein JO215_04190 [Ktedonobacteraceae bacterium]|nr:hypothetical protein [Ktedonobacteraceae bacterium]MBV9614210.1 hypothetical protein [Ktedonobacteraceae bacterium]